MPFQPAAALLVAACVASAPARAAPPADCTPVLDGMERVLAVDHTVVSTDAGRTTEGVTVDGVAYYRDRSRGGWKASSVSVKDMVAQQRENTRDAPSYDCRRLPDAVVDGEPAATFEMHAVIDADASSDATIWLSKKNGLPLKTERDLRSDGTSRHVTSTYGYDGVKAPF